MFQKYNFSLWNILDGGNDVIFQYPTSIWLSTLTLVKRDWVAGGGGGIIRGHWMSESNWQLVSFCSHLIEDTSFYFKVQPLSRHLLRVVLKRLQWQILSFPFFLLNLKFSVFSAEFGWPWGNWRTWHLWFSQQQHIRVCKTFE